MTLAEASQRIEDGAAVYIVFRVSPDGPKTSLPLSQKAVQRRLDMDPDREDAEFAGEMDHDGDLIFDFTK